MMHVKLHCLPFYHRAFSYCNPQFPLRRRYDIMEPVHHLPGIIVRHNRRPCLTGHQSSRSRQRKRWGSCTPADRTIRISDMLVGMPGYVLDSVLIHELAHLVAAHHGPAFQELIARFEQQKAADAFLAGYDFARSTVPGVGGQAPSPDLADRQGSACQLAR